MAALCVPPPPCGPRGQLHLPSQCLCGEFSTLRARPYPCLKEKHSPSPRIGLSVGLPARAWPSVAHGSPLPAELEKELSRRPKKVCIVKVVGTRNLWKNIVVLCVNS